MKISLIIPTLNGAETIGELLEGLAGQTLRPEEVIVIDSGSEDGTAEIVRGFGIEPSVIRREDFDHGGTRNMAARTAVGDVLLFMTQDAVPCDRRLLEHLVAPIGKGLSAASFGRHIPRPGASPVEVFARGYNYPEEGMIKGREDEPELGIKTYFFSNACSAVLRAAFEEVGGFPVGVPMNEDMILSYRLINAGYRIAYVPDARVYHSHNYSPFRQFRKYYLIGLSLSENGLAAEVRPHGEGFRFLREGTRFLLKRGEFGHIPLFLFDCLCRYIGFNIGLRRAGSG